MNAEPLLHAPWAVWLHLATVIPAFFLGIWLIFMSGKGARLHRVVGYAYLGLMATTALLTIFIQRISGQFGLIHLLIPLTLFGVVNGLLAARRHDRSRHRRSMLIVFFGALVIAGGFTLYPGRILNHLFFG